MTTLLSREQYLAIAVDLYLDSALNKCTTFAAT